MHIRTIPFKKLAPYIKPLVMRKFFLIFLVLFSTFILSAQDLVIQEQTPTVALGFQPQSFGYNAAEIDLDFRLSPRNWLTIAPKLQFGNSTANNYMYDAYDAIKSGFGLALTYRYFPLTPKSIKTGDGSGPFVSLCGEFLSTKYQYYGNRYVSYTDNVGNEGFTIEEDYSYTENPIQLGVSVNVGYNWRIFDILYLEGFLGVGVRSSGYVYDSQKNFNLGEYSWDTGYSGYFVSSGFRIGVFLNRYKYGQK
jgi:hypothetical protein